MDVERFKNAEQMDLPMRQPEKKESELSWGPMTFESGVSNRSSERQESNTVSYEDGEWYVNGKKSNIGYVKIIVGHEWDFLRKNDSKFKEITNKYEN